MREYTWDEFYESFYDWSESTQVRNLSALISLGPADEVGEIITELQRNLNASNRLLKEAVDEELAFSAEDLEEFLFVNDEELVTAAIYNSRERLTAEDMEVFYGGVDDDVIIDICSEMDFILPEELRDDEEDLCADEYVYQQPKKPGFFATLFGIIAGINIVNGFKQHSHNGHCNGDCAHCPPHYGYRYGRWYYGHDHVYGCEFGGNKGSGSMD